MLLDFFVSETFEKIVFLGCSFKFGKSAPLRSFRKEAYYCREKQDCATITLSANIGKKRSRFSALNICLQGFKTQSFH